MKCLRSGYCCTHYDVMIVDDPEKGVTEGNVKYKPSGEECQHLTGEGPGSYFCAVHNEPWYRETPCYEFIQIETHPDMPCRMGFKILKELSLI